MGDQIGNSIEQVQIRPLLVVEIPVNDQSVHHPFSHCKIAVCIIPVIIGIKEGRSGTDHQSCKCNYKAEAYAHPFSFYQIFHFPPPLQKMDQVR